MFLLLETEKERGGAKPSIKTNNFMGNAINKKPGCGFHVSHWTDSAPERELPQSISLLPPQRLWLWVALSWDADSPLAH